MHDRMKKILIVTNIPSPYRVQFFDELCRYFDVTVVYAERSEDHKSRDAAWYIAGNNRFHAVSLEKRVKLPAGQFVCTDILDWLKKPFDEILLFGYATPTFLLAELWLKVRKRPFYMEVDGGLISQEAALKRWLKRLCIGGASGWFSTGKATDRYLTWYGADPERLHFYPFSSLMEADIQPSLTPAEEKEALRRELGVTEKNMILAVGRFIPVKGFDVMLRGAAALKPDTGLYFVGGEPTEEYLELAKNTGTTNVHFVGFCKKPELSKYYRAADVSVLPTRGDVWGLVVNEAMAYGLPVVTTNRCVAGLELVEDGVNGYLVPSEDPQALAEKLNAVLDADLAKMGQASLNKIRSYTIEAMAKAHRDVLA